MTTNLFLKSGKLFPYMPYLTRKSVQIIRREWIKAQQFMGGNTLLTGKVYHRGAGNVLRNEFRA